ncbi:MAG TPA: hypothetical protein VEB22_15400 [Phycisphaerales bacterium]|nr:hypothetical protein [Phycisphaerales bacterium]
MPVRPEPRPIVETVDSERKIVQVIKGVAPAGGVGGGADLSDDDPAALGAAAAPGTADEASRSDHVHPYPTAAQVGADPAGTASAAIAAHVAAADPHPGYATDDGLAAETAARIAADAAEAATRAAADTALDSAIDSVDAALTAHTGAAAPHSGHELTASKGQANGYASLNGDTRVPDAQLGTGSASGTNWLRGDRAWATPTAAQVGADAAGTAAAAVSTHAGQADPHTGYQLESEKGAANGYAGLGSDGFVPTGQLGSGPASSSTVLRGDKTWGSVPGVDGDVALVNL